jgi:hypothetical protein
LSSILKKEMAKMEKAEKKKGLFSAIKESMTKTTGCNCGPGDDCYVKPEEETKEEKCCSDHSENKKCK